MSESIIQNPEFLEPAYRFIAVEAMRALSPVAAAESADSGDYAKKQMDFLHSFGTYLVCLNASERYELFDLLDERYKAEESQLKFNFAE